MKNLALSRVGHGAPILGDLSFRRFWTAMQVARERRALARLSPSALADLGLTETAAHREANRSFWDLPSGR